jgi:hypothetical protein
MWVIVSNKTNEILNIYVFPVNKETKLSYGPEDITTDTSVRLIEVSDECKVGDILF